MSAGLALLAFAAAMLGADGAASTGARVIGLYNVVIAPFTWVGQTPRPDTVAGVQTTLVQGLTAWSDTVPAIQVRGPERVRPLTAHGDGRGRAFAAVAADHNADVVLTGQFRPSGSTVTVTVELFLTDRAFGETPEFVGRHEITVTEPADVFAENITVTERLAESTLHYLNGVVAFVRGLGNYVLDDFAGAERHFIQADGEFDLADAAPGSRVERREVVHLMLGNAIGRRGAGRVTEAAAYFQMALAANPAYARAVVGLAEATRVSSGCATDHVSPDLLEQAAGRYRAALGLNGDGDPTTRALLEMKVRLGLGLTYQCVAIAGLADRWDEAHQEFAAVLHLHGGAPSAAGRARHARLLAADARAGQALVSRLTAATPRGRRFGGLAAAAGGYEEALRLVHRVDGVRRTYLERELVYLRNLRDVRRAMRQTTKVAELDARITDAGNRLARVTG